MAKLEKPGGNVVYKVLTPAQWTEAESQGEFLGADIDQTDGYIHFSSASQVRETVAKHFDGEMCLVLVGVDAERLGDDLRWESSRGGNLFPHLYDKLSLDCVVSVDDLPIGKNGQHIFPDEFDKA